MKQERRFEVVMYCAGNSWLGRLKKGGRNREGRERQKRSGYVRAV